MKRAAQLQPPTPVKVTIIARESDPVRHRRLVHLLAVLLDKPDAPDESHRP